MRNATPAQVSAIHLTLKAMKLLHELEERVEQYTNCRTGIPAEMSHEEAWKMVGDLKREQAGDNPTNKTMSKLFALAIEIGWCPLVTLTTPKGGLKQQRDYSRLHAWAEKFGYLKKPLRQYNEKELPKLVSIFETKIYNEYIQNLNSKTDSHEKKETDSPF